MSFPPFRLARIETYVWRVPLEEPVRNSFGYMRSRAALAVRIEDTRGAHGWGEVFSNWPPDGAEHRARLIEEVLGPLALERDYVSPSDLFDDLTARTRVLVLQTDEPGPFAQSIAGLDIAAWDMVSRRAGTPLANFLNPAALPRVPVYASGINPTRPVEVALAHRDRGYSAFKLKVGFGIERDLGNLTDLRAELGDAATLMIDANQAWDLDTGIPMAQRLAEARPIWLEEPLRADTWPQTWRTFAERSPIPLAVGENLRGRAEFTAALATGAFRYLQPDLIKWGGISGCFDVGAGIVTAGLAYCPHYLGGGIGLTASAHLLAAVGGTGMLEVDANPNPLREALAQPFAPIADGHWTISGAPGLGIEPDL
ncbi:MAG: mandelate racemase/muconate lactonizing enzyme family protein, partial [Proteobacteria bacterium]|nr:mandelate racemase/muconate lactonizing enzyme family protein [Burkholderiales bacterium]